MRGACNLGLGALVVLLLTGIMAAPAGAKSRTYTQITAPFELGGFQVRWVRLDVPPPPVNGNVTYMYARLVDDRGRSVRVRRAMLHHILFQNYGRPGHRVGTVCPESGSQPIYGTGEEHQALRLPAGYGYPVNRKDRWSMRAMLMSHRVTRTRVRVQYRVTVSDADLVPVVPFWVRTTGCKGPSYEVHGDGGPGAEQKDSFDWTVPMTGRIVAAAGHLHGGAHSLWLSEPGCQDRRVAGSDPWFGMDNHPVNNIYPLLHEPGPIAVGHFLSKTGVPVRLGEQLRVNATYDSERPHPQVMAVMHVYIAAGAANEAPCAPLPSDAAEPRLRPDVSRAMPLTVPGRAQAPFRFVRLYGLNARGNPAPVAQPEAPVQTLASGATSVLARNRFDHPNIRVPLGASLTWQFRDSGYHNVVLANGPWSAGAPRNRYRSPDAYTTTFPLAGTYQLFCQLHPMTMRQQVEVLPAP